jgi:hypothetical protein
VLTLPETRPQALLWLQVRLLPSFSHDTKGMLLAAATAVLYTPTDEHFGIVPLEVISVHAFRDLCCHISRCTLT